jgi:hypothetical protein
VAKSIEQTLVECPSCGQLASYLRIEERELETSGVN